MSATGNSPLRYLLVAGGACVLAYVALCLFTACKGNKSDEAAYGEEIEVKDFQYTNLRGVPYSYSGQAIVLDEYGASQHERFSVGDTVPHGEGVGVFPSKEGVYNGMFNLGLRHGNAIYDTHDGRNHFEGEYANDQYAQGTLLFVNENCTFEGSFNNDNLWEGIIYDSDGTAVMRISEGEPQPFLQM